VCSRREAGAANPDFHGADPIVSSGMHRWEPRAFGGRSKRWGVEVEGCVCENALFAEEKESDSEFSGAAL